MVAPTDELKEIYSQEEKNLSSEWIQFTPTQSVKNFALEQGTQLKEVFSDEQKLKELSEEETEENKEKLECKPIYITYRDNDNLNKIVPTIQKTLQWLWYTIDMKIFPREFDGNKIQKEVKDRYKESKTDMEKHNFLSDRTVRCKIFEVMVLNMKKEFIKKKMGNDLQDPYEISKIYRDLEMDQDKGEVEAQRLNLNQNVINSSLHDYFSSGLYTLLSQQGYDLSSVEEFDGDYVNMKADRRELDDRANKEDIWKQRGIYASMLYETARPDTIYISRNCIRSHQYKGFTDEEVIEMIQNAFLQAGFENIKVIEKRSEILHPEDNDLIISDGHDWMYNYLQTLYEEITAKKITGKYIRDEYEREIKIYNELKEDRREDGKHTTKVIWPTLQEFVLYVLKKINNNFWEQELEQLQTIIAQMITEIYDPKKNQKNRMI